MTQHNAIHIAAAVITDNAGRCLLVRKRGTAYFMQPGGKIEQGEQPEVALMRELNEELGLTVLRDELQHVGRFSDVAANEPGRDVVAEIFRFKTDKIDFVPAAEIEEVIWYQPDGEQQVLLAPLTANFMIPLLTQ
ncbi:NUDIX hydrolase [Pseudomonas graminis]